MKNPLFIFFLFVLSFPIFGQKQNLFESKEYKEAYEAGTRSRTGMPGEKYWQNRSEYSIKASFDPGSHLISGQLTVKYYNESPDSLNTIVFKLMQNVYKKGAVRQMEVDTQLLHDGVEINNVRYKDQVVDESVIRIS